MSKCTEIRDFLGDYAFEVEYSENNKFTMFFNSRRNAETVKRCIEVDDSVPNAATAVDFVEVIRCKDCKHCKIDNHWGELYCLKMSDDEHTHWVDRCFFCGYGKRREERK